MGLVLDLGEFGLLFELRQFAFVLLEFLLLFVELFALCRQLRFLILDLTVLFFELSTLSAVLKHVHDEHAEGDDQRQIELEELEGLEGLEDNSIHRAT
jgi:hypothetical protein